MRRPRSVVVAAVYEHPAGHELRVFVEQDEDRVVYRLVGATTDIALNAKASELRDVLIEQGCSPSHTTRLACSEATPHEPIDNSMIRPLISILSK